MSVNAKMTAIADRIRSIRGTSSALTLDDMESQLYAVKTDISNAFNAVGNKNGSYGSTSSSNLAKAINSIPNGIFLDFQVVSGTTKPLNPRKNTIWVKSEEPVTGWAFSVAVPVLEPGGVWFSIGTSGVWFDALDENEIDIYPKYAKQKIGNVLVDVAAMIYKNGKWVELEGKKCIFDSSLQDVSTASGMFIRPFENRPLATIDNGLKLTAGPQRVPVFLKDMYDLTGVSKIIVWGYSNLTGSTFGISLNTNYQSETYNPNYIVSKEFGSSFVKMELDVSTYDGDHYIAFSIAGASSIHIGTIELLYENTAESDSTVGIIDVRIEEVV